MLEKYEAVIFDLDGTLVDSMWMWEDIDVEYLARFGIKLPKDLHLVIEGMSFLETAIYFKERFKLIDSLEKIKNDWTKMAWDKYANEVPLKEGAFKLLLKIKSMGIKAGIATSNSRDLVELVLKKHNIMNYFQSIHTACEVEKGKPSPDIYLLVAKDLKVDPSSCLVFEDVVQGIMAGKNAGMKVCAVEDPFSADCIEEKKKISDYYISNFNCCL